MTRLQQIRARLAAATPGKWVTEKSSNCSVTSDACKTVYSHDKKFYEHKIVECVLTPDAQLIANAPADLTALADALDVAVGGLNKIADRNAHGVMVTIAREAIAEVGKILEGV